MRTVGVPLRLPRNLARSSRRECPEVVRRHLAVEHLETAREGASHPRVLSLIAPIVARHAAHPRLTGRYSFPDYAGSSRGRFDGRNAIAASRNVVVEDSFDHGGSVRLELERRSVGDQPAVNAPASKSLALFGRYVRGEFDVGKIQSFVTALDALAFDDDIDIRRCDDSHALARIRIQPLLARQPEKIASPFQKLSKA